MRICAIVPAFNEAGRIAAVVRGALGHVETVVVIDDGSSDGTADAAEAAGAVCLRRLQNSGKGASVRAGLDWALARDFSHVLFMDGDGQHRPEDIPALVETARRTGADLVIGARQFDWARMPRQRYFSNRFGSRLASALAGREIRDSQCGFRLIRAERLRGLRLRARKYEIEMEILLKLSRANCTIEHARVDMIYEDRRPTSKMKPVRDTVRICLWSLVFRWLAVILAVAGAPAAMAQQDVLLDRIWRGVQEAQNQYRTGSGTIVETRTSALLARPMVFRGKFQAEGTNKFYLEYTAPEAVRIVFNSDYLNVTTGKLRKDTEVFRIGNHVRRTQAYFSRGNSLANLKENFAIAVKEEPAVYEMKLVPRSGRFKKRLNYVIVRLGRNDFLLRSLEVDGTSGVHSRFDIQVESLNTPVDGGLFRVYTPDAR